EPHPGVFADLCEMLDAVEDDATDWMSRYARWELALLSTLGFGLDLAALPGDGPWAVSERTGEIVAPEDDRNALPLPGILTGVATVGDHRPDSPAASALVLVQALRVTGAFLRRAVADPRNLRARIRLVERVTRQAAISGISGP
ncbi:MAG: DNA repair protein RecO C-terminal domain-containing protein, partial [Proteobacteria bacterium]|nr:DNA repair protein RecO C-terminal domain-containing protein [Pseudomonadota bacterium]